MSVIRADARQIPLADESVNMVVCSPPYFALRDYQTGRWEGGAGDCDHAAAKVKGRADYGFGEASQVQTTNISAGYTKYRDLCGKCGARRIDLQIGLERSIDAYIQTMVGVFDEVRRVLHPSGCVFINIADSYAANRGYQVPDTKWGDVGNSKASKVPDGLKPKDLCLIPERLAIALQESGWWIRSRIAWVKDSSMPESVQDRPSNAWEHIFMLTKSPRYFYDPIAVAEPARGTNGAAFSASALTPKINPALDANDGAPYCHGRGNFGQAEITVDGAMTWETKGFQVIKRIRFSIIIEGTERHLVMDLDADSRKAASTLMSVAFKGMTARDLPVRATIVDAAAAPSMTAFPDMVDGKPNTRTFAGTETMTEPRSLLRDVIEKPRAALVTFNFDESRPTLLVKGTLRPAHSLQHTRNTQQTRNLRNWWLIGPDPSSAAYCVACDLMYERSPKPPPKCWSCGASIALSKKGVGGEVFRSGGRYIEQGQSSDVCTNCGAVQSGRCVRCRGKLTAHYAAYPRELVRRCIAAGSPERGVCAACGTPWVRVTELGPQKEGAERGKHASAWRANLQGPQRACSGGLGTREVSTLGWRAQCQCKAPTRPALVLDCFGGTNTTGIVAQSMGRRWVITELSWEYCKYSQRRSAQGGLFTMGAGK